jgi:hypothetical protein
MQRLPKSRPQRFIDGRCEMRLQTTVLVPVRRGPAEYAVGRCDCAQNYPHSALRGTTDTSVLRRTQGQFRHAAQVSGSA